MSIRACLYARYSTDAQSEASVEDQFRVCERLAERDGFEVVAKYSDAAISGGTADRAGYQRMLKDARRGKFDVIVAEDSSRLWRAMAEQSPRLAELADLGIHIITQDLDTRQDTAAILGAVTGAMSEHYRKEIGRRTRRGLEGRARQCRPTGGRAYGYIPASQSASGEIEVDPAQAEVVRRIYEDYAAGKSPRQIASELNAEGVPSPGSSWRRVTRTKSKWMQSSIWGDPARYIGVLNNEIYIGRVVWNRTRWVRSATNSKKRRPILNPEKDWIVHDEPRLRIVDDELWQRVRLRQRAQSEAVGYRVSDGIAEARAANAGRRPSYLLSGLLRCPECGGGYTIVARGLYGCSKHVNAGPAVCGNTARFRRTDAERELLAGLRERLLAPDAIEAVRKRVLKLVRDRAKPRAEGSPNRIRELEAEVANLTDAIASGAFRSSPAIAERLSAAEAALARLRAEGKPPAEKKVAKLLPRVVDEHRAFVDDLAARLAEVDVHRARAALRRFYGELRAMPDGEDVRLEAEDGAVELAVLKAVGAARVGGNVVAGAGFEPATFGL